MGKNELLDMITSVGHVYMYNPNEYDSPWAHPYIIVLKYDEDEYLLIKGTGEGDRMKAFVQRGVYKPETVIETTLRKKTYINCNKDYIFRTKEELLKIAQNVEYMGKVPQQIINDILYGMSVSDNVEKDIKRQIVEQYGVGKTGTNG